MQKTYPKHDGTLDVRPPRFEIREIMFLKDVLNKLIKQVHIEMLLSNITPETIETLTNLFNDNKGDTPIDVQVLDDKGDDRERSLTMRNNNIKVTPRDFILAINNAKIAYKVVPMTKRG